MDAVRWRQIEGLYHAALERPAEERAAFVQQACGSDDVLRQEVESLLARDGLTGGPIDSPAWKESASVAQSDAGPQLAPGTELGPFKILGALGAGGMGAVYRATDSRLSRSVAIKVSHERFSGRFEREARAISALNHPHICTLYDVGPNYLVL